MAEGVRIAVIGSGISGLSAAWLLSRRYSVTLFENDARLGGHSNTVDVPAPVPAAGTGAIQVDTGFIVYNEPSYPNLTALFRHLDVPTASTSMSFAVSIDRGSYEYSGSGLDGFFGQRSNLLRPGHWRMLRDTLRFFREARDLLSPQATTEQSLGHYLCVNRYSTDFIERHIQPMAAAIWSTPSARVLDFPAASFVRFFENHGLLQARNQPFWRTVRGGSRAYVERVVSDMRARVVADAGVVDIARDGNGVVVRRRVGAERFDACLIATHADQALALLSDCDSAERGVLGAFAYAHNKAVLHRDSSFMPSRRRLWSSWNYLASEKDDRALSLTYWMNNLQPIGDDCGEVFVTLNPDREIPSESVVATFDYAHPMFDARAMAAQRDLWSLQGRRRTWFAGSYFGFGFHEDGLQAGLAAAEDIGGVRRPWQVADESGRIHVGTAAANGMSGSLEAAE